LVTYKPLGSTIDPYIIIRQAARTLDVAVQMAVESSDIESLKVLSKLWIDLAMSISHAEQEEEAGEVVTESERQPMGFRHGEIT